MIVEEYYTVTMRLKKMPTAGAIVMMKEDTEAFLGHNGFGAIGICVGYASIAPHRFYTLPTQKKVMQFSGMPWYCIIKPETICVFKTTRHLIRPITSEGEEE